MKILINSVFYQMFQIKIKVGWGKKKDRRLRILIIVFGKQCVKSEPSISVLNVILKFYTKRLHSISHFKNFNIFFLLLLILNMKIYVVTTGNMKKKEKIFKKDFSYNTKSIINSHYVLILLFDFIFPLNFNLFMQIKLKLNSYLKKKYTKFAVQL